MHLLLPFDIVPVETQVPQSAFGVTPASERAVRYAFDVFGVRGDLQVTAVELSTETISLEENLGVAEIQSIADEAGVRPYKIDGSRGTPDDVTPHALRHGVAYRMMNTEDGNTLYDVRNRLRHRSIQTTEQVYDHTIRV